jgi:hypothetical protein
MISKKKTLIGSLIISIFVLVLGPLNISYLYCPPPDVSAPCLDIIYDLILNLIIFIPVFVFALITYKMRDEIYRAWLKFSYGWIPLSMALILIAPEYDSSFIPLYSFTKGSVAFIMSLLFVIISLGIIIWKYASAKDKATGSRL